MSLLHPGNDTEPRKIGSLIRLRRKQMHMTLTQLGAAADLSVGYLSQVERDQAVPLLGTLAQIATALGVSVDYFLNTPRNADELTRQGQRPRFSIGASEVVYQQVATPAPGFSLSSYIIDIPAGFQSETVTHEGEELLYMLAGSLEFTVQGRINALETGDSLHFPGSLPHSWHNKGNETASLLWTGTLAVLRHHSTPVPPAEPKHKTQTILRRIQ